MSNDDPTFWRYWIAAPEYLRSRRASEGWLPDKRKRGERTEWVPGTTVAACRHDPSHVPPEPSCSCGIFAMGACDMTAALAGNRARWDAYFQNCWFEAHGGRFASPPIPESPTAQVKWMREHYRTTNGRSVPLLPTDQKLAYQLSTQVPTHVKILGRVALHDAVRVRPHDDLSFSPFRAHSATLLELMIRQQDGAAVAEAGGDVDALAVALSARYRVSCRVGELPPYGQADWDARTRGGVLFERDLKRLGVLPPGVTPRQRFSTVTLPG